MGSFDVGLNAFLHYKPLVSGSVMWWYERKLTAKGVVVIGVGVALLAKGCHCRGML